MDGDAENCRKGRDFYDSMLDNRSGNVRMVQSWITAENINDTLRTNRITGEIDLLSIDIDGNDYWVWKAINAVQPRVVIAEYNAGFGPEKSVTIPYQPSFDRWKAHPSGMYFGASLAALTKLGREKGYALIGCDTSGANAFYVRNDALGDHFARMTPADAYFPQASRIVAGHTPEAQARIVESLPCTEV